MVPDAPTPKPKSVSGVAVQENGLPEGVKIIPLKTTPLAIKLPTPALVPTRNRVNLSVAPTESAAPTLDPLAVKPRKRKPGRPKAPRLDTPPAITPASPSAPTPPSPPAIEPKPAIPPAVALAATTSPAPSPRRMSDLAPRPATVGHTHPAHTKKSPSPKPKHQVHKIGVPPLHFGAVIGLSLRSRVQPHFAILAAVAALCLATVAAYAAWLVATGGLSHLTNSLVANKQRVILELLLLSGIYYIGRSLGQTAITYGLAREADARPATLAQQIAVGINTFGRRLKLDLSFGLAQLTLTLLAASFVLFGGGLWPVNTQIQVGILFISFLAILYLLTALALAQGLANVALTLTNQKSLTVAKLGWQLFSHRLELLGLKFIATALELLLALPLALLAVVIVSNAPSSLHAAAAIGAGLLAWLAGTLFGAGTASWWTALYRKLVLVDYAPAAVSLLSSRQPAPASAIALTIIASLSSCLITAALAVPWLRLANL